MKEQSNWKRNWPNMKVINHKEHSIENTLEYQQLLCSKANSLFWAEVWKSFGLRFFAKQSVLKARYYMQRMRNLQERFYEP